MDLERVSGLAAVKGASDAELDAAIEAPSKTKSGKEKIGKLLLAAEAYLQKEEPGEAVRVAKDAAELLKKEKGDKESEAVAQLLLSRAQAANGNFQSAFQATIQATKLFKDAKSKKGEAATLLVIAQVYMAKQCYEDACWKAAESRKLFKSLGDKKGEGCALEVTARCNCTQQELQKGLDAVNEALSLASGDALKEGSRLVLKSQMQLASGDVSDALEVGKQALSKIHDAGDNTLVAGAVDAIVGAYLKRDDADAAINTIQLEVDGFKRSGSKRQEAAMMLKRSEVRLLTKEPDQGISPAKEAEELSKSIPDKKGEAQAQCMQAQLRLAMGEAEEAMKLSQSACMLFKEVGKKGVDGFVAAFDVIMGAVAKTGAGAEAYTTASEAVKSFNVQREKKGEAAMLMAMSDIVMSGGNADGALEALSRAPQLFAAAGDKRGEATAWSKIAQLHITKKEPGLAVRAAEEAQAAYRKLGDRVGKAAISQLLADAHFALVPRGQGNGREAMRAAMEAMADYRFLGERHSEATSMHLLANAQLMMQATAEAMKTARSAQQIFQDLGDQRGQGGAMLLIAGAHLADGDFADAKDVAKEAKDHFKEIEDAAGEESADEFLDALKKYEKGDLNRFDFMGFSMSVSEEQAQQAGGGDRPRKKQAPLPGETIDNNVNEDDFILAGPQTGKYLSVDYDGIEVRAPGQEASRAAARRAGKKGGEMVAEATKEKDAVLYAVRMMPAGEDDLIKVPKDILAVEDRRINLSLALGCPYEGFGGQFGKTDRMFQAMGAQKFV